MNSKNEIEEFIKHFEGSEYTFLHGCCYWFALILHERFGLEMVYEPAEGHFLATHMFIEESNDGSASYRYRRYDIRGDVTEMYRGHEVYSIDWLMATIVGISPNDTITRGMERWLYQFKKNSVRTATFDRLLESYKSMNRYFIAEVRIMDLCTLDIQDYIDKLRNDGYALTTIKKQFLLVSAFVRFLISVGMPIAPSYISVHLPTEEAVKKPRKSIAAYNKPEQIRLGQVIKEDKSPAAFAALLMLETGMRCGEAMALHWSDIDWDRRSIDIHATLLHAATPKRSAVQNGAKSKSSNRVIPISTKLYPELEARFEVSGGKDGFLLQMPGNPSMPIGYNVIRNGLKDIFDKAKVDYRGMHAFRHTFATNCYYKGCEIKILSKMLGHASVTITYNTYIHLYGDALDEMRTIVE